MRLSRYLLPILKENPADAVIASHRYMLRGGFVKQINSGLYSWLPLGLRVLKNIENILRKEMDNFGANELLMPILQPADLWRESDRYDAYGPEMMRLKDRHDRDMLLGPTNEEMITDIFRSSVKSYKSMPQILYHTQWKFRDEIRPRFGVMRAREFLMKDAYSFDLNEEEAKGNYKKMMKAYLRLFKLLGLNAIPMKADTGPIGGDLSHEFLILAPTGESDVYYDSKLHDINEDTSFEDITNYYAASDEQYNEKEFADKVPQNRRVTGKGIEVGHIFYLGTKYSKMMNANVINDQNQEVPVFMGCYGIGISRLVAAAIEASHDENGIIWHKDISPFKVGIINLSNKDNEAINVCDNIYNELNKKDISTLYDDTPSRAGEKFAKMDLIGLPFQIIIGTKGIKDGTAEVKNRYTGKKENISLDKVNEYLTKILC